MDLVRAANPLKNCKRKQRHLANYRSAGFVRTVLGENGSDYTWVVCRFSPHSETVLYLGDDEGNVAIVDIEPVTQSDICVQARLLHLFPAHNATVMDVVGVPNCPNQLLSISGDTTVRLWDVQRNDSTLFYGHEMSVRSASFAPESGDVFATGGRDGQIRLWDKRTSSFCKQGQFMKKPVNVYRSAHVVEEYRTPSKRKGASSLRLSGRFEKSEPPSVTSLVYANEYTLVSASSCGKSFFSGLRIWDTRKHSVKEEGHVMSTLEIPISKDAGVTCICLDRFGSSLFAAVTDNCVYEYGILTSHVKPVRHFTGAAIESFYVQVQASPCGDYLLCGSKNQQAVVWDIQELYCGSDPVLSSAEGRARALLPKFTLNGHDSEVCCVGWSRSGRYIVSMDDEHFRVWSVDKLDTRYAKDSSSDRQPGTNGETITAYEPNESEKTTLLVNRMSIGREHFTAMTMASNNCTPRKRKEPFTSPIKRLCSLTKSPISKMIRLTSPVLPLAEITNAESGSPGSVSRTTPRTQRIGHRCGAFHYRYPTEHLPNKVYERFVAKFKAKRLAEKQSTAGSSSEPQPSSVSRRSMVDFCVRSHAGEVKSPTRIRHSRLPSASEFGDSVCSKMLSEQDRALQNSPRKLTVKLTPLKSRPLTEVKEQKDSGQRRSSRNLFDYFTKN